MLFNPRIGGLKLCDALVEVVLKYYSFWSSSTEELDIALYQLYPLLRVGGALLRQYAEQQGRPPRRAPRPA